VPKLFLDLCALCASVVNIVRKNIHHGDTENTKEFKLGYYRKEGTEGPKLALGALAQL
jgi:hypothetical protein